MTPSLARRLSQKCDGEPYLWLEMRCKLRGDLYSVVAPLRITVLHVCVAFVACAGASVVHI